MEIQNCCTNLVSGPMAAALKTQRSCASATPARCSRFSPAGALVQAMRQEQRALRWEDRVWAALAIGSLTLIGLAFWL